MSHKPSLWSYSLFPMHIATSYSTSHFFLTLHLFLKAESWPLFPCLDPISNLTKPSKFIVNVTSSFELCLIFQPELDMVFYFHLSYSTLQFILFMLYVSLSLPRQPSEVTRSHSPIHCPKLMKYSAMNLRRSRATGRGAPWGLAATGTERRAPGPGRGGAAVLDTSIDA